MRWSRWSLLLALPASVASGIFFFQRRLLYFPERYVEAQALDHAARIGLDPLREERGAVLGWRARPVGPVSARLLVLHGNAGSALDRVEYAAALAPFGVEVFLLEYPGYGARPGQPSLASLGEAAAQGLDELRRRGSEPIWVLGESLGSGVAGRAVALRPGLVQGLVLVTPFARLIEVARAHYPFLPPGLLRDRFAPQDDLAAFGGPAVVVVAGRDEVVGAEQGRQLFQALRGPRKLVVQPEAGHNGLELAPGAPLWREVVGFLRTGGPTPG